MSAKKMVPSVSYSNQVIIRCSIIYSILTFVMYYFEASQQMLINYIPKEKFENTSKHDLLTGLSNHRDIIEKMAFERERHLRLGKPFTLILGDIDNFKNLNNTFGHEASDYVLRTIGSILKNLVRGIDCPSRWGGEEFLIMLVETDVEGGQRVAERVRRKIENTNFKYDQSNLPDSMTFCLSIYQITDNNIDECMKTADKGLYEGKNREKNKVVVA